MSQSERDAGIEGSVWFQNDRFPILFEMLDHAKVEPRFCC